jgi:hypothetical protein
MSLVAIRMMHFMVRHVMFVLGPCQGGLRQQYGTQDQNCQHPLK